MAELGGKREEMCEKLVCLRWTLVAREVYMYKVLQSNVTTLSTGIRQAKNQEYLLFSCTCVIQSAGKISQKFTSEN